ncbi:hypothetical protein HGRIS_009136 [Hohenbuehelia grisea]|uniref:Uncharacterized protein n=1 Tax=Hohenbuehelia grisea TaxID=104357 RepID=A0ABR3J0K4_9AGAR
MWVSPIKMQYNSVQCAGRPRVVSVLAERSIVGKLGSRSRSHHSAPPHRSSLRKVTTRTQVGVKQYIILGLSVKIRSGALWLGRGEAREDFSQYHSNFTVFRTFEPKMEYSDLSNVSGILAWLALVENAHIPSAPFDLCSRGVADLQAPSA